MSIEGKHFYRFTYLKSEEWRTARLIALAKAGGHCALCGKVDWSNDAHHKKYPEDIWDTTPNHLVILCRCCHEKVHQRFGKEASKRQWSYVNRLILEDDKIAYRKQNPEDPFCIFCGKEISLTILKDFKGITLWICDPCDSKFRKFSVRGLSFWKTFDLAKTEIRFVYLTTLLAAKRYFYKTQRQNRKIARTITKHLDELYG